MKSKRATKAAGTRISCTATAMKADTREIPLIDFSRRLTNAGRPVSSLCLLRQVSSVLSRNCRNEPWPDVDEAQFAAANLWHGDCMSTVGSACLRKDEYGEKNSSRVAG